MLAPSASLLHHHRHHPSTNIAATTSITDTIPNVSHIAAAAAAAAAVSAAASAAAAMPIPTPAPVAHLLQPGLSPVFSTCDTAAFHRYLTDLITHPSNNYRTAPPSAPLTPGVLPVALSYPHVAEHVTHHSSPTSPSTIVSASASASISRSTSRSRSRSRSISRSPPTPSSTEMPLHDPNIPLTPTIAARIAHAVPALAVAHGFRHFQVWIDIALFHRRHSLKTFEYWRRRVIPFLSLPVLYIPSPRADRLAICDDEFRTRLESIAAALGKGRFIASFRDIAPTENRATAAADDITAPPYLRDVSVSFRYEAATLRYFTRGESTASNTNGMNCNVDAGSTKRRRCDSLRSRFDALVFMAVNTTLLDRDGACENERAFFRAAAITAWRTVEDVIQLRAPGGAAWRGVMSGEDDGVIWRAVDAGGWRGADEWLRFVQDVESSSFSNCSSMEIDGALTLEGTARAWGGVAGACVRRVKMFCGGGHGDHPAGETTLIIVCGEGTTAGVALALAVDETLGFVERVAMTVLEEPSEFLEVTSEAELAVETGPYLQVVKDMLVDGGVMEEGDQVTGAGMVDEGDPVLRRRLLGRRRTTR